MSGIVRTHTEGILREIGLSDLLVKKVVNIKNVKRIIGACERAYARPKTKDYFTPQRDDFTLNYPLLIICVSIFGYQYWALRKRLSVYFSHTELKGHLNELKDDVSDEMKESIMDVFWKATPYYNI